MRRMLRDSLSPSMAVALLALVLAVGGTGFAAATLASGSADRAIPSAQPVLRSGEIMRGNFGGGGGDSANGYFGQGITWPKALPAGFVKTHVQFIESGDPYTPKCPGPGKAAKGWACFYEGNTSVSNLCCIYDEAYNTPAVGRYGTTIYFNIEGAGSWSDGRWAVRAP